ncbi:hypothetical protein EX30DRAFT_54517 [Ascodesmis nigricans]|uniref:Uncharacterized protein n=1 Tax=Ascodesmis nigricans TaxID=341454 RepID=A0A4S2MVC4_9PEZI|nr:hypothetical protein EX30DRAFT_54517 [Ascodesmis nigricans]
MRSTSNIRALAVAGLAQVFLATALPTTNDTPSLLRRQKTVEKNEQSRSTWVLAGGLMVGIAVFLTLLWVFWRRKMFPNVFSRKQKVHDISGPMVTGDYSNTKATKTLTATKSVRTKRSSMSELRSSLTEDHDPSYNYRTYNNIASPASALAPSNLDLSGHPSRRHLIREDLLTQKSQQNSHSFFVDDKASIGRDSGYSGSSKSTTNDRRQYTKPLPTPPKPAKIMESPMHCSPPPIPESPERRYSWMSGKTRKTNRTSMESEPPKFRGVDSWVGDQAGRMDGRSNNLRDWRNRQRGVDSYQMGEKF